MFLSKFVFNIDEKFKNYNLTSNIISRDFGAHLKTQLELALNSGKFYWEPKNNDRNYLALKRLIENDSMRKYPRVGTSTATGLNASVCKEAISDEFLEVLRYEDQPFYKRIFSFGKKNNESNN